MHAKTMVVDGVWSTIGSTNFDNRSFALNQELNLTMYDAALARRLEEIYQEDLKHSKKSPMRNGTRAVSSNGSSSSLPSP